MKHIRKDELYENLGKFLKGKGVELKEGPYTKGVHAGCSMLADAINMSQNGLERAKTEIERRMDQVRQAIHEKTAPKPPSAGAAKPPQPARASRKAGDIRSPKNQNRAGTGSKRVKGQKGRSRPGRK